MITLEFEIICEDITPNVVSDKLFVINEKGPLMVGDLIVAVVHYIPKCEPNVSVVRTRKALEESMQERYSVCVMVERRAGFVRSSFPTKSNLLKLKDGQERVNAVEQLSDYIAEYCVGIPQKSLKEEISKLKKDAKAREEKIRALEAELEGRKGNETSVTQATMNLQQQVARLEYQVQLKEIQIGVFLKELNFMKPDHFIPQIELPKEVEEDVKEEEKTDSPA